MAVAFKVSEVVEAADHLRAAADEADTQLAEQFETWAETVADIMRSEIPIESGETRDSVTVEYGDGLTATIGPTNTDLEGRPVGFFVNYGAGNRAPNDFIGRTGVQASDAASFDVSDVL